MECDDSDATCLLTGLKGTVTTKKDKSRVSDLQHWLINICAEWICVSSTYTCGRHRDDFCNLSLSLIVLVHLSSYEKCRCKHLNCSRRHYQYMISHTQNNELTLRHPFELIFLKKKNSIVQKTAYRHGKQNSLHIVSVFFDRLVITLSVTKSSSQSLFVHCTTSSSLQITLVQLNDNMFFEFSRDDKVIVLLRSQKTIWEISLLLFQNTLLVSYHFVSVQ